MKRSKLCFGLLSALVIMLGLSSSVYLEDTNAASHDYIGIPFLNPCLRVSSDYTSLIPYDSSSLAAFCDATSSPLSLDFSSLAIANSMFLYCYSLEYLALPNYMPLINEAEKMFENCIHLNYLNLSF